MLSKYARCALYPLYPSLSITMRLRGFIFLFSVLWVIPAIPVFVRDMRLCSFFFFFLWWCDVVMWGAVWFAGARCRALAVHFARRPQTRVSRSSALRRGVHLPWTRRRGAVVAVQSSLYHGRIRYSPFLCAVIFICRDLR
ncbi:hypothetical protein HYPSUDRAFT_569224 [Hypholoma sublateritium FD-334 SS-4]|uniref:Uncharacterized protein n=1 Tax=Hypholoma sublateritium (strain FD-334 SS-4) TaxID=945553 RepID=A0A0D2P4V8_HYPSF|nr:hypothetical protein HYPSUDRAFT_569224 [Hypholoma sublateritium FD-334 SS-4]